MCRGRMSGDPVLCTFSILKVNLRLVSSICFRYCVVVQDDIFYFSGFFFFFFALRTKCTDPGFLFFCSAKTCCDD